MFSFCCRSVEKNVDNIDIEQVFEASRCDTTAEQECNSQVYLHCLGARSSAGQFGACLGGEENGARMESVVMVGSAAKGHEALSGSSAGAKCQEQLERDAAWRRRTGPFCLETEERASCGGATASTASCPSSRSASDLALTEEEMERQREIELCQELGVLLLPEDDESELAAEEHEEARHRA